MLPRGFPYALFLLSASGKVFGAKVAMVSVGAGAVNQPVTRWLFNSAARLAFYRSYREPGAKEAMRKRGLDVSRDNVYPDLAFALPVPSGGPVDDRTVAVGVMAYYGTNDERKQADEIYVHYVDGMKRFVRWLLDDGRKVLLIVGDTNGSDSIVVDEILADLRAARPDLDPSAVTAAAVTSYSDVMRVLQPVSSVVAIRYHNILCALQLSKPTISIGYSPKHDVLMAEMGLPEFCQAVSTLDIAELTKLFTELDSRSAELRRTLLEHNAAKSRLVEDLFAELSATLFPPAEPASAQTAPGPAVPVSTPRGDGHERAGQRVARAAPQGAVSERAAHYKKDFWGEENLKFSEPWYRLEKSGRIIRKLAGGRECTLLDIGCGPATLMRLLPAEHKILWHRYSNPEPSAEPHRIRLGGIRNRLRRHAVRSHHRARRLRVCRPGPVQRNLPRLRGS